MKEIREKLERDQNPIKNYEQVYMKKLIRNRTRTDTATLLKNLSSNHAKEASGKFVAEKHNI